MPSTPRVVGIVTAVLHAWSCGVGWAGVETPLTGSATVPLTVVEFSGHRYVAPADFGLERPVPLMIHGNAALFLSLTHRAAERLTGGPVKKLEEYGYSSRGRGAIDVPRMRVGGEPFEHVVGVPVFDFTEDGDSVVQGMLGTEFLTEARAVVDFSRSMLVLGAAASPEPNPRLLAAGYKHVRMSLTPRRRLTIEAYFPAIDRVVAITPSTVSIALTLHQPLFAGRVPMTKQESPDRSPSGTTPDEYFSDEVRFEVAGVACGNAAAFEDLAEYAKVSEDDLETYGMLGFDWMAQHGAIIDYANLILYFRP